MTRRRKSHAVAGMAFLLALTPPGLAAQTTSTLTGTVRDVTTGQPLQNAIVEIPARSRAVLTGADGVFSIADLPPGTHVLRVRQFGYADFVRVLELTGDRAVDLDLSPDPVELEGLDVAVDGAVTLGGRVIDGGTGMTMPGVYVWLPGEERGVMSDSSGVFRFEAVPTGPQIVQAEIPGYGRRLVPVVLSPPVDPVDLVLMPDSAVLAGLPVVERRLRARRNASMSLIFALGPERLTHLPAKDTRIVVQNYTLARVVPCVGAAMSHWCIDTGRGGPREAVVCIDGEVRWGGLDELQRYRPHELYLLEVSGPPVIGSSIRAYTHEYIASLSRRNATIMLDEPSPGAPEVERMGWALREDGLVSDAFIPDVSTFRC